MRKNSLLYTNILVCLIITVGFVATSIMGYRSNTGIFKKDVEHVSTLAAEGIYYQIDKLLSEPINVSLAMANDNLLKTFLKKESQMSDDQAYIKELGDYLHAYRQKYKYDSVFLVSSATNRYYHFNGLDRVLKREEPEDEWYYSFLNSHDEYSLNIDNDQAGNDSVTVFVNCKIKDADGQIIGIIGVGLQVYSLQELLHEYNEEFAVQAFLIDDKGVVQISSKYTGYEQPELLTEGMSKQYQNQLADHLTEQRGFWHSVNNSTCYVVTQYVSNLKWRLIVENDMTAMNKKLTKQFFQGMLIIVLILLLVLWAITNMLQYYKQQIMKLSASQKQEYQRLLSEVSAGMYESVYEFNITKNCAGTDDPQRYFKLLDITLATPLDEALRIVASKQIKEEYAQGYLDIFCLDHVMACYNSGITNLSYDFLATLDGGENYHWIRSTAQIFYWPSDESVRMISYRKNFDMEKKQELMLIEKSQIDSLTGLLNKRTTEDAMTEILRQSSDTNRTHALLICDIDNFKNVNDRYGHAFGDAVISEFAAELKAQFRDSDIVGRVGGDEFAVLMLDYGNSSVLEEKTTRFCDKIAHKDFGQAADTSISCSLGIAIYPEHGAQYVELCDKADQALYCAKAHGKGRFHLTGVGSEDGVAAHINSRDIRDLLECSVDGVVKYACTKPLKMLYFNQKMSELVGLSLQQLSLPDFDPMSTIHPDDYEIVQQTINKAMVDKRPCSAVFRIRRNDQEYIFIKLQAMFVNELYQNKYSIFYAVYTDLTNLEPSKPK